MLRWIVEVSLNLRFFVIVIAVGIIAFGVTQLGNMPVDVYPEFNPPLVEIQTEALGLSAEEVEALLRVDRPPSVLGIDGRAYEKSRQSEKGHFFKQRFFIQPA